MFILHHLPCTFLSWLYMIASTVHVAVCRIHIKLSSTPIPYLWSRGILPSKQSELYPELDQFYWESSRFFISRYVSNVSLVAVSCVIREHNNSSFATRRLHLSAAIQYRQLATPSGPMSDCKLSIFELTQRIAIVRTLVSPGLNPSPLPPGRLALQGHITAWTRASCMCMQLLHEMYDILDVGLWHDRFDNCRCSGVYARWSALFHRHVSNTHGSFRPRVHASKASRWRHLVSFNLLDCCKR